MNRDLLVPDNTEKVLDPEFTESIYTALKVYSNVHRGSGHFSAATTALFENARRIVLDYLELAQDHLIVFCTPARAESLKKLLKPGSFVEISSEGTGLSLGVRAIAVEKKSSPRGIPPETGGGTTKLVSAGWEVWADAPGKFEAGTPAIINIVAFARALQMKKQIYSNVTGTVKNTDPHDLFYNDEFAGLSGMELFDRLHGTIIGNDTFVPTCKGDQRYVNLDNAASTPAFRPVWDVVYRTWEQPTSAKAGIIEEAAKICHEFLGAPESSYKIIFTSNTTEAINLAAESFSNILTGEEKPLILNSLLEHNSNDLPWRRVKGCSILRINIDVNGFIDIPELERALSDYNERFLYGNKRIRLVALCGASNVMGTCNDLLKIGGIVHRYKALFLVDAAQLVAHRRIDMQGCGIDYLAFSGHKAYAPFGSGALVLRNDLLNFTPERLRQVISSGEENAGGIAAMGKSFILLKRIGFRNIAEKESLLASRLLAGLSGISGITIHGIKNPSGRQFEDKGCVVAISMKGIMPNVLADKLSASGIGVRYGCHCAHILVKHILRVPAFLENIQRLLVIMFPAIRLPGVLRVSAGIGNATGDIDRLIVALKEIKAGKQENNLKMRLEAFSKSVCTRVYS